MILLRKTRLYGDNWTHSALSAFTLFVTASSPMQKVWSTTWKRTTLATTITLVVPIKASLRPVQAHHLRLQPIAQAPVLHSQQLQLSTTLVLMAIATRPLPARPMPKDIPSRLVARGSSASNRVTDMEATGVIRLCSMRRSIEVDKAWESG